MTSIFGASETRLQAAENPAVCVKKWQIRNAHGGELEEQGAHDKLLALGGKYSELYCFHSYEKNGK